MFDDVFFNPLVRDPDPDRRRDPNGVSEFRQTEGNPVLGVNEESDALGQTIAEALDSPEATPFCHKATRK